MNLITAFEAYVSVVDAGGFAAAARHLGQSRAVINKQVKQLEAHLGTRLLNRSTRVVTPTETGLAFYERCRFILDELGSTVSNIQQLQSRVQGSLRINVPMSFGTLAMGKAVAGFMAKYPDIHVEMSLNDRFVDPIEEGFDVTVRVAELQHFTSLVTVPLTSAERLLVATPDYAMSTQLKHPTDLRRARCLHYGLQQTGQRWQLQGTQGAVSARLNCVMWSNNGEVLKLAALAHQGVALLPRFIVDEELARGLLTPVLPDYATIPLDIYLLYPRHRYLTAKVSVFVEHMVEYFAASTSR